MRTEGLERRQFLTLSAASFAAALMPLRGRAQEVPAASFTFDNLVNDMRDLAQSSYAAPKPVKGFLADLDYDAYQRIRFRPEQARWQEKGVTFRLHAFHPGWLFKEAVKINEVRGETVEPMGFTTADFEYDDTALAKSIPPNAEMPGVAGFRLHTPLNRADIFDELIVFQGASSGERHALWTERARPCRQYRPARRRRVPPFQRGLAAPPRTGR